MAADAAAADPRRFPPEYRDTLAETCEWVLDQVAMSREWTPVDVSDDECAVRTWKRESDDAKSFLDVTLGRSVVLAPLETCLRAIVGEHGRNSLCVDEQAIEFRLLDPCAASSDPKERTHGSSVFSVGYKRVWPTSRRETLVVSTWQLLEDGRAVAVVKSLPDHPEFTGNRHAVRATVNHAGWVFSPLRHNATIVEFCADFDLGGSVPGFVKNHVTRSLPLQISKMKEIVE
jgi:hypothetical protein